MKAVFLLSLLLLATMVQDSEAGFLGRLGDAVKKATSRVTGTVKKGVSTVTGGVKDAVRTVKQGVRQVTSGVKDAVGSIRQGVRNTGSNVRSGFRGLLRRLFRGKRSALTMNRMDDVNAVDIATTLKLDLPAVKGMFVRCDWDKSGSLDGQEVLTFLRMIENLAGESRREPALTL